MTDAGEAASKKALWPRIVVAVFVSSIVASITYALYPGNGEEGEAHPGDLDRSRPPSLAYWFWTPDVLEERRFASQARDLAARGSYDLIFATPRYPMSNLGGVDFTDTARFRPLFEETARILAASKKRFALDLRFYLGANGTVREDACEQILTVHPVRFDADGRAVINGLDRSVAQFPSAAAQTGVALVAAYDRETGERRTDVRASATGDRLSLNAARRDDVIALVARRYNHADMFSDAYPRAFERVLAAYRDIGLGGAGLDEFAYLPIDAKVWRDAYYYSPAATKAFKARYEIPLEDAIARIALDDDARKWRLAYFTHRRLAIARMERTFYDAVKRHLGPGAFVGVHPTNHNSDDLEFALTALDWWAVKRDFGQTDERTPMAIRMAIALKAGGRVWYNMFYDKDRDRILDEIVRCARFGGRVHYHAYHDAFYGYPLETPGWLEQLAAIDERLAPLDRHALGVPELDTLVILGWPWMVDTAVTGTRPVLTATNAFLDALWDRGHRAAAVASYEIDAGALTLGADGRACYGGRTFAHCVFWHPEFSDEPTAKFLRGFRGRMQCIGRPSSISGAPLDTDPTFRPKQTTVKKIIEAAGPTASGPVERYPKNRGVLIDREALIHGRPTTIRVRLAGRDQDVRVEHATVLDLGADRR